MTIGSANRNPSPAAAQLRHADRWAIVARLLPGIAHDLSTPLNVVVGRARLIASGSLDEAQVERSARIVAEQSAKMAAIVVPLLDFARDEPAGAAAVDPAAAVDRVLELLAPFAHERRVTVTRAGGGESIRLHADCALLRHLLAAVVVNAIQATPRGGAVTIEVHREHAAPPGDSSGAAEEVARLVVQDGGSGIPPAVLPGILLPFVSTRPPGDGAGLGLAVAAGIAREHGGWVAAHSDPGCGARIEVFLPLARGTSRG
ncbi:MAG: HAMP domain-containing histidine kinase [Deltaproteobacteria bacterium]|nr:HAMP domain-containing histidine kinase [Deltaproteobacteria bacterium]